MLDQTFKQSDSSIFDIADEGRANAEQTRGLAETLGPMFSKIFDGSPPIRFEFWDGSALGPDGDHSIHIKSPVALRRVIWAPSELGLARAYVAGDADIVGPLAEVLRTLQTSVSPKGIGQALPAIVRCARQVGALSGPPPSLPEEITSRGRRHSTRRDQRSIGHHYDVGNEFYELVLGPTMTYSCARFAAADTTLEEAQTAKHELVCRKLGLAEPSFRAASRNERPRLLDVGCGWGTMALHAAAHHDVEVVGVTISESQARLARERVEAAGLSSRVQIRLQDYRTVDDGPYDAISSIGMAEHVGRRNMGRYAAGLAAQLRTGGRMLNHAIASVGGSRMTRASFVGRFVFPDGELLDLADTITSLEQAGLEIRDVENLREHYATTLGSWIANLEARWDNAVELVGERRARIWRLYMSGSVNGFDDAGLQVFQTLGVRSDHRPSDLPPTRRDWE